MGEVRACLELELGEVWDLVPRKGVLTAQLSIVECGWADSEMGLPAWGCPGNAILCCWHISLTLWGWEIQHFWKLGKLSFEKEKKILKTFNSPLWGKNRNLGKFETYATYFCGILFLAKVTLNFGVQSSLMSFGLLNKIIVFGKFHQEWWLAQTIMTSLLTEWHRPGFGLCDKWNSVSICRRQRGVGERRTYKFLCTYTRTPEVMQGFVYHHMYV